MRTGVCVTSENDIHPYIPLRILRISIQAMVLCQLQWHQHCDVNVRALTGLLTNTHNVPYPCTASLCTMPCIPALHHYPQFPASLYCITTHNALHHYPQCPASLYCITTHNALHPCAASLPTMLCIPVLHHYPQCPASLCYITTHNALHPCTASLPTMPCITTHNALHPCTAPFPIMPCIITPSVVSMGFYFLQDVGASLLPPPLARMIYWAHRDGVAGTVVSSCRFSCSLGSSSASCFILAPGQVSLVCRQAMCLQRQQMPSHLKVHLSLEHSCSNHFGESIKTVTDFLLSCYLNSTRSVLTYTPGQCSLPQKSCENPSGPSSQMVSILFFFFFFFYMKFTGIELLLHEYLSI